MPTKDSKNRDPQKDKDTALSTQDDFNRFFDETFGLEPMDFFLRRPSIFKKMGMGSFPKINISETDKEVKVLAEVPGVNVDNIDIDVHDNWMCISGTVEEEKSSDEKLYRYERSYGEFRREFTLPARVDEDNVKASCKDGILTITLPKLEIEHSKKIPIEKL